MMKRRRFKYIASALLPLAALLLLSMLMQGCAGSSPQPTVATGQRYCIWLLWLKDKELLEPVTDSLEAGEPFMITARRYAQRYPQKVRASADCMPDSGLDPQVLAVLSSLDVGQVSDAFDLEGGVALVMRTTDQYRQRGQAYFDQGEYVKAEDELKEDLKLHPASAPSWHVLALCRAAQKDYEGAVQALNQGLKWDPDNTSLYNDKASALGFLGRQQEAMKLFEKAHALDPSSPVIAGNLAWILYLHMSDLDRALELAQKAATQRPRNKRFARNLVLIEKARRDAGPTYLVRNKSKPKAKKPFRRPPAPAPKAAVKKEAAPIPEPAPPQIAKPAKSTVAPKPIAVAPKPTPPPAKPALKPEPEPKKPAQTAQAKAEAVKQVQPKTAFRPKPKIALVGLGRPRHSAAKKYTEPRPLKPTPAPTPAPAPAAQAVAKAPAAPPAVAKPGSAPTVEYPRVAVAGAKSEPGTSAVSLVPTAPEPKAQRPPGPSSPGARGHSLAKKYTNPQSQTRASAPKAAPAPKPKRKHRYYIYVGSYRKLDSAKRAVRRWVKRGFAAKLERWRKKNRQIRYQILVGPFSSKARAQKMRKRIKKKGWAKKPLLVRRRIK